MTPTRAFDNEPKMEASDSRDSKPMDPFLDVDVGPALWTNMAPTGRRYWPFIVLLAIGLSGFSYYWRNHWVPSQPLIWQTGGDSHLRNAIGSGHPVLVWYDPVANHTTIVSQENLDNHPEDEALSMTSAKASFSLAEAIGGLDVPDIRRSLRLNSAELWKVESPLEAALTKQLMLDAKQDAPALILWHSRITPPRMLGPAEIHRESIVNWLEATRQRHDP